MTPEDQWGEAQAGMGGGLAVPGVEEMPGMGPEEGPGEYIPSPTPIANADERERLSAEVRAALAKELGQQFSNHFSDSRDLRDRCRDWRDQYEGILPAKTEAWSANVNVPITEYMVDTACENLEGVALTAKPIFQVEATHPEWQEDAYKVEQWVDFWCDRMRFRPKAALAIHDALIVGTSWLKQTIEFTGRPAPDMTLSGETPIAVEELDAQPSCEVVMLEDMMILPFNVPSLRQAKGAFSRLVLRWDDVQEGADRGRFYLDAVDRIGLEWAKERGQSYYEEALAEGAQTPPEIWSAEFECWEGVYRWVKPGDTREREWLLLVAYNRDEGADPVILRCADYRKVFACNWFFTTVRVNPRPGTIYGRPMTESLRGLQNWSNATFSQATDVVSMHLRPPIAIPAGSTMQRRGLKWGPQELWPISNPAEVKLLEGSGSAMAALQASFNQMEMVRQMCERVTGVTDVTMGRPTPERRTAFEIGVVVESGNRKFDRQVARLEFGMDDGEGLEGFAQRLLILFRQFMPQRPVRYRTSTEGYGQYEVIEPTAFEGEYQFTPHATNSAANPETRFKRAFATIQEIKASPFCIPTALDAPEDVLEIVRRWWRAENDYLQAMGHKDTEGVIGRKPEDPEKALARAAVNFAPAVQAIISRITGVPPEGPGPPGAEPGGAPGVGGPAVPAAPNRGGGPSGPAAPGGPGGGPGVQGPPQPAGMGPL